MLIRSLSPWQSTQGSQFTKRKQLFGLLVSDHHGGPGCFGTCFEIGILTSGWPISSSSSPVQEGGREREGENTLVSPLLETLITSGTPPVFMTSSNSDYLPKTVLSSIQVFLEKVLGIETPGIRYAPKSILNVSVIRTIKYYVQMNHAVQNYQFLYYANFYFLPH